MRPLFAFGHGLSYTTFEIGKAAADKNTLTAAETVTLTIPVKNTGSVAGAEVVQVYIRDVKSSLPRPQKELKAFQKVYLQPGEQRTVSITLDRQALSYYDDRQGAWVAEPGDFEALIGTSSDRLTQEVKFALK